MNLWRRLFRPFRRDRGTAALITLAGGIGLGVNGLLLSATLTLVKDSLTSSHDALLHGVMNPAMFLRLAASDRSLLARLPRQVAESSLLEGRALYHRDEGADAASRLGGAWGVVNTFVVSPSFFEVLRVKPCAGPGFATSSGSEVPKHAVLSTSFWRRAFGSDPAVLGRVVKMPGGGSAGCCRIVGVMPESIDVPPHADVWIADKLVEIGPGTELLVRRTAGVTSAEVTRQFSALAMEPLNVYLHPAADRIIGLLALTSGLFLIVCWLQFGAMLASRRLQQEAEAWIRSTLGATPAQLRSEAILETCGLTLSAVVLALCLLPGLDLLLDDRQLAGGNASAFLGRAAVFVLAAGACAAALLPAASLVVVRRESASLGMNAVVREDRKGQSLQHVVMAFQVALVTALLALASLIVTSFLKLSRADPGFDTSRIWAVSLPIFEPSEGEAPAAAKARAMAYRISVNETINSIRKIPSVAAVSSASVWPFQAPGPSPALVQALADPEGGVLEAQTISIGRDFFKTLAVPMLDGVGIQDSDRGEFGTATGVAAVSLSLADQLRRFGSPVGQRIRIMPFREVRVVGIVPDISLAYPDRPRAPMVYSYFGVDENSPELIIRMTGTLPSVRDEVTSVLSRYWPVGQRGEVSSLQTLFDFANGEYRTRAVMAGAILLFSFPVIGVGLLATVAEIFRQRTRTLMIKAALGAAPSQIVSDLLRRIGRPLSIGTAIGIVFSLGAWRNVGPTFSGASVTVDGLAATVLAIVGLVAVAGLWPIVILLRMLRGSLGRVLK